MTPVPSISTVYFADLPIDQALPLLRRAGWRYVELSEAHARHLVAGARDRWPRVIDLASDVGITFLQGHLPTMHDPKGGWAPQTYYDTAPATDARLQAIVRSLDSFLELFATLGIPLAVLHVGGFTLVRAGASAEIALARRAASVDAIADAARRRGIRISIETMYFPQSGARTLEQIERIIAAATADDLGICLDTGHANLAGVDLPTLVLRAPDSIDTLHLNDNDGRSDSHNVPSEDGSVPWPAVLSALRAAGYHGPVNLEVKGLEDAGIETRLCRLRKALKVARDIARQISGEAA